MELDVKTIWNEFRIELLRYIRSKVHDYHTAEDILQEVFIKIHKNLDKLGNYRRLKPWLYTITQNTIIDYYRKKREDTIQIEAVYNISKPEDESDSIKDSVLNCMQSFVNALPEPYKEELQLFEFEGLKHKEIADKLSISVSSSKTLLQRGRGKLKSLMTECCDFEFDSLGKIIEYKVKDKNHECNNCQCDYRPLK